MALRYWVGGTGTWDATATTNWSATSGGAGGASVPGTADDVIFDSASGAADYTVTRTATTAVLSITMNGPSTGALTFAGTSAIGISTGNLTVGSTGSVTWSNTGTLTKTGSGTITTNAVTINSPIVINGSGITVSLGSDLTMGTTRSFTLTAGTLNLSTYSLNCGVFSSSNSNTRSITFGSGSAINITNVATATVFDITTITGFTHSGTSAINLTGAAASGITRTITVGAGVYLNFTVSAGDAGSTVSISSGNNITFTSGYSGAVTNSAGSINGALTLSSSVSAWTSTTSILTFLGSANTITTAGKTIGCPITVTGTLTLLDSLTVDSARTVTINGGTLNINDFNFTCSTLIHTSGTLNNGTGNFTATTLTQNSGTINTGAGNFTATTLTHNSGTINIGSTDTFSVTGLYTLAGNSVSGSRPILNLTDKTINVGAMTLSNSTANYLTVTFGTSGVINLTGNNTTIWNSLNAGTTTYITISGTPDIRATYSGSVGTRTIYNSTSISNVQFPMKVTAGNDAISSRGVFSNYDFTGFSGSIGLATTWTITSLLRIPATVTSISSSSLLQFNGTVTVDVNGETLDMPVTVAGGSVTLASNLVIGTGRIFTISAGTFNTNGFNFTSDIYKQFSGTLNATGSNFNCTTIEIGTATTFNPVLNFTNSSVSATGAVTFVSGSVTSNGSSITLGSLTQSVTTSSSTVCSLDISSGTSFTVTGAYSVYSNTTVRSTLNLSDVEMSAGSVSVGNYTTLSFGTSGRINLTGNNTTIWNSLNFTGNSIVNGTPDIRATYSGSVGTRTISANGTITNYQFPMKVTAGNDVISSRGVFSSYDFTGFSGSIGLATTWTITSLLRIPTTVTTISSTSLLQFNGTVTVDVNGETLDMPVTLVSGTTTLSSDLVIGTTSGYTFTITAGTFNTDIYNFTCHNLTHNSGTINVGATNTFTVTSTYTLAGNATQGSQPILDLTNKTINVGAMTLSNSTANYLTVTFGTSGRINLTGSGTTIWNSTNAGTTAYVTISGTLDIRATYSGSVGTRTISTNATTTNYQVPIKVTAGTDIIATTGSFNTLDFTGFSGSIAPSGTTTITSLLRIPATVTSVSSAQTLQFVGTVTVDTNGDTIDMPVTLVSGTTTLSSDLVIGSTRTFTLTAGTLNTNGSNFTCGTYTHNSGTLNTSAGTTFTTSVATNIGTASAFNPTVNFINSTVSLAATLFYSGSITTTGSTITAASFNQTANTSATSCSLNVSDCNSFTVTGLYTLTGNSTVATTASLNLTDKTINVGSMTLSAASTYYTTVTFGTSGVINLTGNNTTIWNSLNAGTTTYITISGTPDIRATYSGSVGTRTISANGTITNYQFPMKVTAGSDAISTRGVFSSYDFTGFSGSIGLATTWTITSLLRIPATVTSISSSSLLQFNGTVTVDVNGETLDMPVTLVAGTTTLSSDLVIGSSRTFTLTAGTLNTNGFNFTCGTLTQNSGTINTGAGNFTATNLTHNSGTINVGATNTFTVTSTYTLAGNATQVSQPILDLTNKTISVGSMTLSNSTVNYLTVTFGTSGRINLTGSGTTIWNSLNAGTTTYITISGTPDIRATYSGSTGTRAIYNSTSISNVQFPMKVTAGNDSISTYGVFTSYDFTGFSGSIAPSGTTTITSLLRIPTTVTTISSTSLLQFNGTVTVDTNGDTIDMPVTLVSGTTTLTSNLVIGSSRTFTLTAGTLNTNGSNFTCGTYTHNSGTLNTSAGTTFTTSVATNIGTASAFNPTINFINSTVSLAATLFYSGSITTTGSTITAASFNQTANTSATSCSLNVSDCNSFTVTGLYTLTGNSTVATRAILNLTDKTINVGSMTLSAASTYYTTVTFGTSGVINLTGNNTTIWSSLNAGTNTYVTISGTPDIRATYSGGSGARAIYNSTSISNVQFPMKVTAGSDSIITYGVFTSYDFTGFSGSINPSSSTWTITSLLRIPATVTSISSAQTLQFVGTVTVDTNGDTLDMPVTLVSGTTTLASNLVIGSSRTFTLTAGTFNTGIYNFTCGTLTHTAGEIINGSGNFTATTITQNSGVISTGTGNFTATTLTQNSGTITVGSTNTFSVTGLYTLAGNSVSGSRPILNLTDKAISVGSMTLSNSTVNYLTVTFGTSGVINLTGNNTTIWNSTNAGTTTYITISGTPDIRATYSGGVGARAILNSTSISNVQFPMKVTAGSDSINTYGVFTSYDFTGFSGSINPSSTWTITSLLRIPATVTSISVSASQTLEFNGTVTVDTNGDTIDMPVTFVSGTTTLSSNLVISSNRAVTLTAGTVNVNGFNFTCGNLTQNSGTLNTGTGTFTATSITQNSGTINVGASNGFTVTGVYTLVGNSASGSRPILDLSDKTINIGSLILGSSTTWYLTVTFGTSGVINLTGNNTAIWNVTNTGTTTYVTINGTPDIRATYSGSVGTRTIYNKTSLASFNQFPMKVTAGSDTISTRGVFTNYDFTGFSGSIGINDGNLTIVNSLVIPPTLSSKLSSVNTLEFNGQANLTTGGIDFDLPVTLTDGSLTLNDSLTMWVPRTFTITAGTLNTNGNNITCNLFSSSNSNTRTLNLGSSTITLTGTGTVWDMSTSTGSTVNAGTSKIVLSNNSTTSRTFAGGGRTYYDLIIGGVTSTSTTTITGNNTFNDLSSTKAVAHTISFTSGGTTTFRNFNVRGSSGNLATITASSTTEHTFVKTGGNRISSDYLNISYSTGTPANTWYAGKNSIQGISVSGWVFDAPQVANSFLFGSAF